MNPELKIKTPHTLSDIPSLDVDFWPLKRSRNVGPVPYAMCVAILGGGLALGAIQLGKWATPEVVPNSSLTIKNPSKSSK